MTAQKTKRFFLGNFPSWDFSWGELRNRAKPNYTKAPPAWLGGGIARSDANPHPVPLPLATGLVSRRATSAPSHRPTILPPKEEACRQLQLNLQAPPPAALPKPDHRPNCRCQVGSYRVVVRGRPERRAPGGMGGKEHRMHLSVTLLLLHNSNIKNDCFALFLVFFATDTCCFANTHSMMTPIPNPLSDVTFLYSSRAASTGALAARARVHRGSRAAHRHSAPASCL